jgi:hypothetical protein
MQEWRVGLILDSTVRSLCLAIELEELRTHLRDLEREQGEAICQRWRHLGGHLGWE